LGDFDDWKLQLLSFSEFLLLQNMYIRWSTIHDLCKLYACVQ